MSIIGMNFTTSILCEDVTIPPAGSRITYTYITGGEYPNYEKAEVSSFLSSGDFDDVIRCVDSLRAQADFDYHCFIEGFEKHEFGYRVILGS